MHFARITPIEKGSEIFVMLPVKDLPNRSPDTILITRDDAHNLNASLAVQIVTSWCDCGELVQLDPRVVR